MSLPARKKADVVSDFRRAQILDAARQYFARHGVADTTVADIAGAAGVAKGTVYLYYQSKDEILRQILTADLAEYHDDTVPAIRQDEALDRRVAGFLRATLAFFDRKRDFIEHCQLEMTGEVRRKARQKLSLVFAAQTDAWRHALEAGAHTGTVRVTDAGGAARGIVSLAHGLAIQRLRGWHTGSIDDTVTWATDLLLKGLTSR